MVGETRDAILRDFKAKVCNDIRLESKGVDRYQVLTPFTFDDGDGFVVYLVLENGRYYLTDGGHTIMHLSYWMDTDELFEGDNTRSELFRSITGMFNLEYDDGQIRTPVGDNRYGEYLYSYLQALTKISDIDFLSRERVKRAFLEDLISFLKSNYEKVSESWSDPARDEEKIYAVDVRLDLAKVPFFVYAVWSNERALTTVISILKYREWINRQFRAIIIHEYFDELSRPNRKKLTDASDKQMTSFYDRKEEIKKYIDEEAALLI